MKKKIISIIGSMLLVVAVSVLLAYGILALVRKNNVAQTGNLLGVSWYNETDKEFTITTKEELYELAKLSDFYDFKNQTIKLGADIVVNEGNASEWDSKISLKKWNPINGFAGTFDGQGHTISGIYGRAFDAPMALFVRTNYNCVIKDLKLVNSCFETTGESGTSSFVSKGGGEFVKLYSDAIINCKGEHSGGIASSIDAQSIFDECWFDGKITITGRDGGGIVDEVTKSRVTMRHCLFSGEIESTYKVGAARIGGFCGSLNNKGSLVVTDCLSSGKITSVTSNQVGSAFGRIHEGTEITVLDSYTSLGTYCTSVSSNSGVTKGVPIHMFAENLVGAKAYQWTTLDFDKYWTAVEENTPVLKSFTEETMDLTGVEKEYDISWYTAGSYTFKIQNKKQLYGFYIISASDNFSGKTVQLASDITVNTGKASSYAKNTPEYKWLPIYTFAGTFDGQGHTISGIYLNETAEVLNYSGLFSIADVGSVLKNFRLENSYFERSGNADGYGFVGSIVADSQGTVDTVYSDAIIVSDGQQVGGIVGRANGVKRNGKNVTVTVNNCWFDGKIALAGQEGRYGGGIVGLAVQGNIDVSNCLNTGALSAEAVDTGVHLAGIVGSDNIGGNINITGCLNVGPITVAYDTAVGSVLGRVGNAKTVVTIKDTYATAESYHTAVSKAGFRGTVNGGVLQFPAKKISGVNGYRYTALDFEKYWGVVKDSTPVLKSFFGSTLSTAGLKKAYDTSWYNADAKTFTIKNAQQLLGFALMSAMDDFKGKTVKLGANIVFNEGDAKAWAEIAPSEEWIPIGTIGKPFAGTFDGQGHTISGIYIKDTSENTTYSGLFGVTGTGSMVKNFRLTNSYFERTGHKEDYGFVGSVVSELRGTLDTVYSDAIVITDGTNSGGLVGRTNGIKVEGKPTSVTVSNCWYDGEFTMTGQTGRYGAGIVGISVQGTLNIANCLNTGKLSAEAVDTGVHLAGILGSDNAGGTINIKDCLNAGPLNVKYSVAVGSILGRAGSSKTVVNIENTYATKESYRIAVSTSGRKGTVNGGVFQQREATITGYGGYRYTALDFDKYWAVDLDGTPILKSFATEVPSLAGIDRMFDISWYEKDEYVIESAADLYGLYFLSATDSFEGKTVKLGADIVVNTGDAKTWETTAPNNEWLAIGSKDAPFAGTFDGQGHTISGVYLRTNETYQGLFGYCSGATIKNVRLVNSYFENYTEDGEALIGSIVGNATGTGLTMENVYSDAMIKSRSMEVGGLIGYVGMDSADKKVNLTNCWFNGDISVDYRKQNALYVGGCIGVSATGAVVMDTCYFTGDILVDYTSNSAAETWGACVGGFVGSDYSSSSVQLKNCMSAGIMDLKWRKNTNAAENKQSNISRTNQFIGRVNNVNSSAQNSYTLTTVTKYIENTGKTVIQPTDKKYDGLYADPSQMESNFLGIDYSLYGQEWRLCGIGAQTKSNLPFAVEDRTDGGTAIWASVEGKLPVPATLKDIKAGEQVATLSGKGTKSDPYMLMNAADLALFAKFSQTYTFAGEYVALGDDIDVNEGFATDWQEGKNIPSQSWIAIGTTSVPFMGTFDGDGHQISGVYMKTDAFYQGLFSSCSGATIKNVRLTNSYFENYRENNEALMGSIIGYATGTGLTMENVYSDTIIKSKSIEVGGMIGYVGMTSADNKVNLTSCWFDGNIDVDFVKNNARAHVGGYIGVHAAGSVVMDTCYYTGDIDVSYVSNDTITEWRSAVGGYVGTAIGNVQIKNSMSAGQIDVAWNKNTNGTANSQAKIIKTNQFIGVNDSTGSSAQNTYALSTIKVYVENTNTTTNRSGSEVDITDNSGVIWNFLRKDSELYGAGAKFKSDLPFTAADRVNQDGGTAYWSAIEGKLPVPASLSDIGDREIATVFSGDGSESNPYMLMNAADLALFVSLSQNYTFAGEHVALGDDIVVNEGLATDWKEGRNRPTQSWIAIGTTSVPFMGTFDGDGHQISGVYMKTDAFYQGLFSSCSGATIKNVRLTNSYFENYRENNEALMGSIIGYATGTGLTMENVYSDAIIKSRSIEVGGMIGYVGMTSANNKVNLTSCWFDGDIDVDFAKKNARAHVGGYIGVHAAGTVVMDTCYYTGDIDVSYVSNDTITEWRSAVGGYVGTAIGNVQIKNSMSAGQIDVAWNKNTNGTANSQAKIIKTNQFIGVNDSTGSSAQNTYALSTIKVYVENTNTTTNRSGSEVDITDSSGVIWNFLRKDSELYGASAKSKTVLPFAVSDRTDGGTAIWATVDGKLPVPATLKNVKTNSSNAN